MDRRSITRVAIAACIALLLVALPFVTACAPEEEKEVVEEEKVIKIAFSGALTGVPADSAYPLWQGAKAHTVYLNETKGGIEGVKIEFLYSDSQYSLPRTLSAYKRFRLEGILGITPLSGHECEGLKPLLEKDHIVGFGIASGTRPVVFPPGWVYTGQPLYHQETATVLKYYIENVWDKDRPPKWGHIGWDNDFGRVSLEARPYAESIGYEFVGAEWIPIAPLDTTIELLRLKEAGADVVTIHTSTGPVSIVLKDAAKIGYSPQFIGAGAVPTSTKVIELAGELSEGYMGVMPYCLWDDPSPGARAMREWQVKVYGKQVPNENYILGYTGEAIHVEAVRQALLKVGYDNLTGDALREHGYPNVKDFTLDGMLPPINFGDGVVGCHHENIVQVKGGKLISLSEGFVEIPIPGWE